MSNLKESIEYVVDAIVQNSRLPKYQFERASEPLIAPFMNQWLSSKFGRSLRTVAVEVPIKKCENYQSTNADYLMVDEMSNWYLIEVKTRKSNLLASQLDAYARASMNGADQMLKDSLEIEQKSIFKEKYRELNRRIQDGKHITVVLVTPHRERPGILRADDYKNFKWFSITDMFTYEPTDHRELWSIVRRLGECMT